MVMVMSTSASALGIKNTKARLAFFAFFCCCCLYRLAFFLTTSTPPFPIAFLAFPVYFSSSCYLFTSQLLSPSRCPSVTHLHLGSLGHGRGSSLDQEGLPLASHCAAKCWASLLSFTYPACPIRLTCICWPTPPMILRCTCLVLSCHFFVNHSAFLSACLFVEQS